MLVEEARCLVTTASAVLIDVDSDAAGAGVT